MGKSPQTTAAEQEQTQLERLASRAYPLGFEAIRGEQAGISTMMGVGGEPTALREAFGGSRAGLLDASVIGQDDALRRERAENRGAAQSGNLAATLGSPADAGTAIARALYGSRITEGMGAIEERDKLLGMSLGQSQTTGSGSLAAFGNELRNIPMMQNYNSSYANVLGALNLGASIYGAGSQAGWFSSSPSGAAGYGNPFAGAGSTASVGFEGT